MSKNTYDSDDNEYGVTASAIHYSDSDDDTISYTSLQYENGLKIQFKNNYEKSMGERPTTPEIRSLAISNGGRITVYNSGEMVHEEDMADPSLQTTYAISMSDLSGMSEEDQIKLLNDIERRCDQEKICAVWEKVRGDTLWRVNKTAAKRLRGKTVFCL